MNKKTVKISLLVFITILLIVIVFIFIRNKASYKLTYYDSYDAAEQWGKEELGTPASVFKVIKIEGNPNDARLIVYLKDDMRTVYISLIETCKNSFQYSRVSPAFNIGSGYEPTNVSYEILVTINHKDYFISIGRVDENYKVFSNEEELMIGDDRIFININASEKNQIKFVENTF